MRAIRFIIGPPEPEGLIESGGRLAVRPQSEPIERPVGRPDDRFDQPGPDPAAAECGGHVKVTDAADSPAGQVRVDIEAADAHDPYLPGGRVGRVRHLYVAAAFRRRGIGAGLVEAVIRTAHGTFDRLRLRTDGGPGRPIL